MDIERAFSVVGGLGRFQIFFINCSCFVQIVYGCQMVLMVIVGATPNPDIPSEANLTTIVTDWNLYDEQWIIDLISSLYMVGFGIGSVLSGQLSDLYGRKWIFIFNFGLFMLFGFCTAFCTNWKLFAGIRTLTGLFAGGSGVVLFPILLENVGNKYWAPIGMLYQTLFSVGMMLLSLFAYTTHKWQYVCIASCFGVLALPIFIFIIPESSRWLYSVGRLGECERVLLYIAKKNGKDLSKIELPLLKHPTISDDIDGTLKKYSIVDLFKIRVLTKYAICCFYMWFACSFMYYGLTFDASVLSPNIYVAVILSGVIEVPAILISFFLMQSKWMGRKGTILLLLVISTSSSIGLMYADALHSEYLPTLVTVLGLSNKLSIAGVFAIVYIYVSEIFPTQLRVLAIGGSSMFARAGAIISPFVPLLIPTASYLPYIMFGFVTVFAAASGLFLPETLNQPVRGMSDFTEESSCQENDSIQDQCTVWNARSVDENVNETDYLLRA